MDPSSHSVADTRQHSKVSRGYYAMINHFRNHYQILLFSRQISIANASDLLFVYNRRSYACVVNHFLRSNYTTT